MLDSMTDVNCFLFLDALGAIEDINRKINDAIRPDERAYWAQDLLDKTAILLSCSSFDGQDTDCRNCRNISCLRKRTAELLIKVNSVGLI